MRPLRPADESRTLMFASLRMIALAGLAFALAGCGTTRSCQTGNEDYLEARERPKLQMPENVAGSERLGGTVLVIPPASPTPDKLDPAPRCLDEPPGFFRRTGGAVAGSPEEAVNVWATAWSGRKADQVASFYSPSFQTGESGGSAAFLEQRRQQVANGKAPDPRLAEVVTTTQGSDRAVVTFVQRFGENAVRKELTLQREPQGWRIVAERTLEVL
jgi:hypothetical protein